MINEDYFIENSVSDWVNVLDTWSWLLPEKYAVLQMNRFGDLFLILKDGSIHVLPMDSGELKRLASSKEEFTTLVEEPQNINEWFLTPLVDKLVAAGKILRPGYCYGFKQLPVFGGAYDVDNICERSIDEYLSWLGTVYQQIVNLPEGSKIRFKLMP